MCRRWLLALPVLCSLAGMAAARTMTEAAYHELFSPAALGVAQPGEGAVIGFTRHYRGAMPHAAFAFLQDEAGHYAWAFVGGRSSPAEAEAAALASCRRNAGNAHVQGECRILAQDGNVAGRGSWPLQEGSIGPFRASPLHYWHGPEAAKGVVIWGHGRSGQGLDLRNDATPGILAALNDAGWDVLRYDRHPGDDELSDALPRLLNGLPAVREAGYRQIVLGGQSRGGWQSLLAAGEQPQGGVAVIATAPARHGSWDRNNNSLGAALDDFRRLVADLPPSGPRILVALFDEDGFDPDPERRAGMLERFGRSRAEPVLVLWPGYGPRGHAGASDWRFTRDASACVLALLEAPAAQAPRGLQRGACR